MKLNECVERKKNGAREMNFSFFWQCIWKSHEIHIVYYGESKIYIGIFIELWPQTK